MIKRFFPVLAATCFLAPVSFAEVQDAAPNGFTTVHTVQIAASRLDAWNAAIGEVGQWWSSDHTVSGDAANLRIDPQLLGCFCEQFGPNAGVVHLTVTMLNPTVLLRLTGGLGPLGLMGVDGNMTWEFADSEDGTSVRFTYAVGGYRAGGLEELAGPVDYVIGEALMRLKAFVETGDPDTADSVD